MISIHLKECAGRESTKMTGGQDENYQSPQPDTPVCRPLTIVADDLTGACDAAVAFAPVCDPVRVQISGEPSDLPSILATTTESRDLPAEQAETRIRNLAERLPQGTELFKKIDSVFRGNTVAEIAATLRHAHYDLAVIAPAYPAVGRTVRRGVLYIQDNSAERTVPIAELLGEAGCSLTGLHAGLSRDEFTASLQSCLNKPMTAVLCDSTKQEDLERIVYGARSLGKRILWIGSGGLAHALAAELPRLHQKPPTSPGPGSAIFFIGSPHPVTRGQVDQLQLASRLGDATQPVGSDLVIPVVVGETTADDIRQVVAAQHLRQIGCLFMTGGETAHFVCRALGIQALRLQTEFAPGVPLAIAEGGPFDGVSVVLKSGGFGEPDLLCRLLETCRQEVIA